MALPGNGIFVVKGEITIILTAMRRGTRWSSHSHQDEDMDVLTKNFQQLKEILNKIDDLRAIEADAYLTPFLEVIRSGDTTGPVTSLALAAVNKFLAYGLIDSTKATIPLTVHKIADAVTHARFVGTDQTSDGIVLMRILQLLRTLTLSPEGSNLTNESLCEIMLSCFRICFETRLNELLRRTAEHCLKDMVQLVFARLPQFVDDYRSIKNFKMKPGNIEHTRTRRRSRTIKPKKIVEEDVDDTKTSSNIVDMQGTISQQQQQNDSMETSTNEEIQLQDVEENHEYINKRGIRFTPQIQEEVALVPYGLACVCELFRFLISLCNPTDNQNTDVMIHLGLTLLTVAFEIGADSIAKYTTLLALVKDDLCRNLFSLLNTERLPVFTANLQVCFLMFEALRTHLKYQLEFYLTKLIDIIISDSGRISYEHKEIALDNILQLWRIPGLVTELYLNYDCNMYCTNLYEDLTKLLAKNAFSATTGVYHTHMLSLDALLTVIECIEKNCDDKIEYNEINVNNARLKISDNIPTKNELMCRKNIKKYLPTGSEHFNHKPKKGIQFFQEHGVLKNDSDPYEIALFLKENSSLDKKMIGEYISNRSNLHILDAFVKTFDFVNLRIDEALRQYLETFRLPGEAPTISLLMEHFAEHWHKSNGEPFADVDSAFTLAYAIIMLNVDQHNQNAKKQTIPMSLDGFKKNLKGVNGGGDFDENMLNEIYEAIKNEEIVMPAEQTGLVRENYLWKVLLRKGGSKDGIYYHCNDSTYDSELFGLIWAPTIAALSFIFDRSDERLIYEKAMRGFERCAYISAHYDLTKNMDMLIVTLSKFTTFQNALQQPHSIQFVANFGADPKARLALKSIYDLTHRFGDTIRESWKNILELIKGLYVQNLLPKSLVEAEDFIETSGRILLKYESSGQKQDTSLFSSLYSYMVSSENLSRFPSNEEQQFVDVAKKTVTDCNLEQLINDSKFLHDASLDELIRALCEASRGPDVQKNLGYNYDENLTIFFLELIVKIVVQNRDRVINIWKRVRDHLYTLVMNGALFDYRFLLERSVIDLLRIAIRLMRNEEMSPIVLQSLKMLLLLKSNVLQKIARQVSYGLYELLKTSAQNIHTNDDWTIVFALLECVGAGAQPPKPIASNEEPTTKSDGESPVLSDDEHDVGRGYTSDSEITARTVTNRNPSSGWILVGNEGEIQSVMGRTVPPHQYSLALERHLSAHDPLSLIKCCECLAFLVRDVAHITPYNFDDCVHCIRTFVEASLDGVRGGKPKRRTRRRGHDDSDVASDSSDEPEDLPNGYHQVAIQLLDLMHTLHTRTAQIFRWWAEEGGGAVEGVSLWTHGWCPLLQGIARLCCDVRRDVRMSAITYLQRALLVHDLQTLSGPEWEACFHRVLFPLLNHLLKSLDGEKGRKGLSAMEETRIRAATVLSKVFLHHLTPLLTLATFSNLWLIILGFMDKYMHADGSDLLYEAIPESLKNILLVMDSAGVFIDETGRRGQLWDITWQRIELFLPGMRNELFKQPESEPIQISTNDNVEQTTPRSIILQPLATPTTPPLIQPTSSSSSSPSTVPSGETHTFPVLVTSAAPTASTDMNVFRSANYFDGDNGANFPGADLLYGNELPPQSSVNVNEDGITDV